MAAEEPPCVMTVRSFAFIVAPPVVMPLLFLMNYLYGMYGIIWTQLIADACTACVSFIVYSIVGKKRLRPAGAG